MHAPARDARANVIVHGAYFQHAARGARTHTHNNNTPPSTQLRTAEPKRHHRYTHLLGTHQCKHNNNTNYLRAATSYVPCCLGYIWNLLPVSPRAARLGDPNAKRPGFQTLRPPRPLRPPPQPPPP
eukprot:8380031-Lingulodinium_polyedra.AAC.1